MKKLQLLILLAFTVSILQSCKEIKKEETNDQSKTENSLIIDKETTTINWTAYKTTSKIAVNGQFNEFSNSPILGNTVKEALNGLAFKIPINSLHTNDTIRDAKLKTFFFGNLADTAEITGTLNIDTENSGNAKISMNGISQTIPVIYTINNQTVTIESVLNLENWNALAALEALNAVCFDLHKGEDGISKTWSEVKIEITLNFKNAS